MTECGRRTPPARLALFLALTLLALFLGACAVTHVRGQYDVAVGPAHC